MSGHIRGAGQRRAGRHAASGVLLGLLITAASAVGTVVLLGLLIIAASAVGTVWLLGWIIFRLLSETGT